MADHEEPPFSPISSEGSLYVKYRLRIHSACRVESQGVCVLYIFHYSFFSFLPLLDCYGKDPSRAYAIDLAYDSSAKPEDSIWKGVKGCVTPWPCWSGDPQPPALPPSGKIPIDNNTEASYVLDPQGLEFMIVYAVGLLLVISLVFNCQLANKLKALQQSTRARRDFDQVREANRSFVGQPNIYYTPAGQPSQNRTPARGVSYSNYLREAVEGGSRNSLEEPLLTASTSDDTDPVDNTESTEGVEESKQEAE